MKKLLLLVLMVCFALTGCSSSSGGDSEKAKDPCDGPVPCLTLDWGSQYAVFLDSSNDPYVLLSDGEIMAVSGLCTLDGVICLCAFAGPALNCYDADIILGIVDFDLDGIPDAELTSVSGHLRVCGEILTVSDLDSAEYFFGDKVATYDSMASLSRSNHLSTDAPIFAENVEKIKIRIKLIEQLMEE